MKNNILNIIKERRTTRVFTEDKIKDNELNSIIEAGLWAPSGNNMQPWYFIAIENEELLDELNEKTKEAAKDFPIEEVQKIVNNPNYNIFYKAKSVIVVAYDEKALTPIQDISAATQNMLLAAESIGVGACWNGFISLLFNNEEAAKEYSKRLNLPEGYKLNHAVALGYSKIETINAPKRKENAYTFIK